MGHELLASNRALFGDDGGRVADRVEQAIEMYLPHLYGLVRTTPRREPLVDLG